MSKVVGKLWGSEIWIHNSDKYCMKELHLERGAKSSLHMHKVKQETFLVTFGVVHLEKGATVRTMSAGDHETIMPGEYHRFAAVSKVARVVEASTYHDEADVYRKEVSCKSKARQPGAGS